MIQSLEDLVKGLEERGGVRFLYCEDTIDYLIDCFPDVNIVTDGFDKNLRSAYLIASIPKKITSGNISTSVTTSSSIAAGSITATKIVAGGITATEIETKSIQKLLDSGLITIAHARGYLGNY